MPHGPDLQTEIPDQPCARCMDAAWIPIDVAEVDGKLHLALPGR